MNYRHIPVYSTPRTPLCQRYQSNEKPSVDIVMPSESFYVLCRKALREQIPRYVRDYRPKFSARKAKLKEQLVQERRKIILKDRVDCLAERLEYVRQTNAQYHEGRNQKWRNARVCISNDMKEHLQRRDRQLIERVEILRLHNGQVKNRCELLRYGNYLRLIARQHEERRKRKSIF